MWFSAAAPVVSSSFSGADMEAADIVWGSIFMLATAVEVWAIRNAKPGDTLSERTRRWFFVHTMAGKVVFTLAWLYFAAWFWWHIVG